jgi:hypothetical protein
MFSYEMDAVFEQNFRQKLRVPPLVDPRAVEMNIFADLTTSKRQKQIFCVVDYSVLCDSVTDSIIVTNMK